MPEPGISRAASIFADRYACLDGCALGVLWCRKRKTGHYSTATAASADLQHLGDGYSIRGRERRDGNAGRSDICHTDRGQLGELHFHQLG